MVSGKKLQVLRLLVCGREMTGADICAEADPPIARGTVYPVLQMLQDDGFVTRREERNPRRSGPPSVYYKITAQGERAVMASNLAEAIMAGASPAVR